MNSISQLEIHDPVWNYAESNGFVYHQAWFDVWAELPPVGELLQHLKTLDDLNPSFSNHHLPKSYGLVDTSVILVVPDISESLESIIKHEGFQVLSKAWYESDT